MVNEIIIRERTPFWLMMSTLLFEALKERESTDRKMSFGKWFLFGIITLRIGFIFAFYYLIKRRTEHFKRQRKLEEDMIALLESRGAGESALAELKAIHGEARREEKERNPILWVILSLIPFVSIYTLYFLTVDSGNHAMRQRRFTTLAFTTAQSAWRSHAPGSACYSKTFICAQYCFNSRNSWDFRNLLGIHALQ